MDTLVTPVPHSQDCSVYRNSRNVSSPQVYSKSAPLVGVPQLYYHRSHRSPPSPSCEFPSTTGLLKLLVDNITVQENGEQLLESYSTDRSRDFWTTKQYKEWKKNQVGVGRGKNSMHRVFFFFFVCRSFTALGHPKRLKEWLLYRAIRHISRVTTLCPQIPGLVLSGSRLIVRWSFSSRSEHYLHSWNSSFLPVLLLSGEDQPDRMTGWDGALFL